MLEFRERFRNWRNCTKTPETIRKRAYVLKGRSGSVKPSALIIRTRLTRSICLDRSSGSREETRKPSDVFMLEP